LIPIVFLFFFLSNRHRFIETSHSILGKLISVSIIMYYTQIDVYVGIAVCLLVILYFQTETVENMLNYSESTPPIQEEKHSEKDASHVKNEFRKEYCVENTLKYKNMDVKSAISEHIFPSLQFKDEPCNPCSKTCAFSIIESKLQTENEMIPESSNL